MKKKRECTLKIFVIILLVLLSSLIFAPLAKSILSDFIIIFSNGSIITDSPPDEWVTVYDQDYPTGTTNTIYGLVPTVKSRFIVDVGWDSSGGYLGVGGVRFRLSGTYILGIHRSGTVFSWNMGTNRAIITIDTDSSLGIANISAGTFTDDLPYYEPAYITDRSANIFTPMTLGVSSAGGVATIYHVTQQVNAPGLVSVIGSTQYQAYGYDGPKARSGVEAGMNEIRAAGMNGTIFADVDYILDQSYLSYLNGLVDDGWEVGIHFTDYALGDGTTYTWEEEQAIMTNEYNSITSSFGGRPPLSWCILGRGRLDDPMKEQWVYDNLNMFLRMWRVYPQVNVGSHDIIDDNIDYWMGAANAGVATIPIYVHTTEVSPAPSGSDIDAVLFDQWLAAIISNDVKLTGYQNWYMINSNQLDAVPTSTIGSGYTDIEVDTNGYNAIVLVKIQESTVISVTRVSNGLPVEHWASPEGYIIFEAKDSETYKVTTTETPPSGYTLSVNTVGQGSVTRIPDQVSYDSGSMVQLFASPASGWTFSDWSGDVSGSTNPVSIIMDSDKTVIATFSQSTYSDIHTVQLLGLNSYLTTYADGTTMSSSTAYEAIQTNALDSSKVEYGDTILIKSGIYPLTSGLTGRSGINLKGEAGTVLDVSNLPVSSTIMYTAGQTLVTVQPASTLNKGQTTVTTATNLGAIIDDLIFIWSTDVWHDNSPGLKQGEIRRVVGINGNTLTLEAPLEDTYLQSTTSVSLVEPVQDITIEGIRFLNTINAWDTYPSVQQKKFDGLRFIYGDNIRITNCQFDGIESKAIRFDSVINSRIDHNIFEKATLDGAGYGVDIIYACQNVVIEYCEFYNCRHAMVAADSSTMSGVPRHITILQCYSEDSQYWISSSGIWGVQNQYDCHPVGEFIDFLYNEATGKGYGISHMGYSGRIFGNNFHDLDIYGIRVGTYYVTGVTYYQDEIIVQKNTIADAAAYGIWLGGSGRRATNIQILDNTISGCPTTGITLDNTRDSLINNNYIVGSAVGVRLDSTTENNQGSGNSGPIVDEGVNNNVT